jgi:hypothetical protein
MRAEFHRLLCGLTRLLEAPPVAAISLLRTIHMQILWGFCLQVVQHGWNLGWSHWKII